MREFLHKLAFRGVSDFGELDTKEARQNKLSNVRLGSYGERSGTQFSRRPLSEEGMRCSVDLMDGASWAF